MAENFHIRLVQPNIKQIHKWDKTKTLTNLKLLINLTRHDHKKKIDLVVWPETAVLFDIMDEENKKLLLKKNLENIDHLIIGGIRKEMVNKKKNIYNSLFLIDKTNNVISYHDKVKLVPFGEFIPFRNILMNYKILLGGLDFSSGKKISVLKLKDNIKIYPLDCVNKYLYNNLKIKH